MLSCQPGNRAELPGTAVAPIAREHAAAKGTKNPADFGAYAKAIKQPEQ